MAAGSVIGAMANRQNIDLMGGFRRSLPFTSALLIIGCLALAAFPGTSGFFSKDEILAFAEYRGGFYVIFVIGGYIGALLTAFYAFRIGFRVAFGPPSEVARDLEQGVHHHVEPQNPMTGEPEDTDVGFPGEKHTVAEDAWPMKIAMSILGVGALFAGLVQIPGVDDVVHQFLHGSFEDSPLYEQGPSVSAEYEGLAIGGVISLIGIGLAYLFYIARPGLTAALERTLPALHTFLDNKWYFDELIDALVYRPVIRVGRFANDVVERVLVDGIVGATTGAVRELGLLVRGAQSGFIRAYALLVLGGFAALALYFLVVSN
jgi:NADH-quinone oxidoreductase subunit L